MNRTKLEKIYKVFKCLNDTTERTTDLENVYNDRDGSSVSWREVNEARLILEFEIDLNEQFGD